MASRAPLLLVCACVLVGCGESGPSDEEQIRATLAEFGRATAARDYPALCDRILAPELVGTVERAGLTCEAALAEGFGDVSEPQLTVGSVRVEDGAATAQVRSSAAGQAPSEDTVELVRAGGAWRIAALSGGQDP